MSRYFRRKQRRYLYLASEGKCERCGAELEQTWDAHHRTHYASGGLTEIYNGMALCQECHRDIHKQENSIVFEPRGWQKTGLDTCEKSAKKHFLLEATPGAGKTIFSGFEGKRWLDDGIVDFIVIVVPTTGIKGDAESGFLGDWSRLGIDIKDDLNSGAGMPKQYNGAVITYQKLPLIVDTFERWVRNGNRIGFVFDEVHHASESNTWGAVAARCAEMAVKVLSMTGTPFRGDGGKIAFVNYDEKGSAIPDYAYTLRQAVSDTVCRKLEFFTDDGQVEYVKDGQFKTVGISSARQDEEGAVKAGIFDPWSEWMSVVIRKADADLNEYRKSSNAGGIVVCRPGSDENDDRHILKVAQMIERVTGEKPVIVSHDDVNSNAKITAFRRGTQKWIVAVRKVSEGVDLKRLKVMVMANAPGTQLLFRQLIGRVIRQESKTATENASVYIAKFKHLEDWAQQVLEEVSDGIKEKKQRKPNESDGEGRNDDGFFSILNATHEDGGALNMFGDKYGANEVDMAHALRSSRKLNHISVTDIAAVIRAMHSGASAEKAERHEPLNERKDRQRKKINELVRKCAVKIKDSAGKKNPYKAVWVEVLQRTGAQGIDDLMDNHPVETADAVIRMLAEYLGSVDRAG